MQLCETIEALNLSLKPALAAQQCNTQDTAQPPTSQQALPNNPSNPLQTSSEIAANLTQDNTRTRIAYRNTPPTKVSIASQSIYSPFSENSHTENAEEASNFFNASS